MKKILLVAAVSMLALASCKKDYTCKCTATQTEGSVTTTQGTTEDVILNSSKSDAELKCSEGNVESSITIGATTVTSEVKCNLQ